MVGVVVPRLQLSPGSRSCCLRVRMQQCQRLAPPGPPTSNSSSQRWLWSIPYHCPLPLPPHRHPRPRPHPPPGCWSTQELQLLHTHKEGRLRAATNTIYLWTLRWTTLMVKTSPHLPFTSLKSLSCTDAIVCLLSTDMPLLKET